MVLKPESSREWLRIALSNLASIFIALIVVQQTKVQVTPELMRSMQGQIDGLFAQVNALQTDKVNLTANNITLRLKLAEIEQLVGGTAEGLEIGAIDAMFSELDRAGWCKEVVYHDDSADFVMVVINSAYEIRYDISASRYLGRTDWQTQAPEVAEVYVQHDMDTLAVKDTREFREPHPAADGRTGLYTKWYVELPVSGLELICGLEVGEL